MVPDIVPVPQSDKTLLWSHFQDYAHELTQYGTHRRVNGEYPYPYFDLYWREPERHPFWAMAEGKRAAFALVRTGERTEMAEFYSLPQFRRTGVALPFAQAILRRFPGPWELTQYKSNAGAVAFWRRVIANHPFEESTYVGDSGVERLRQTFTVPASVG